MPDVEAHITGTVWKIEVAGRRQRRRGRHRGDPRVDEDGDAGRGRGRRQRHGDPLRGGPGGQRGRHARRPRVVTARSELADGRLLLDEPAEHVARLTIANPAKRNALDHDDPRRDRRRRSRDARRALRRAHRRRGHVLGRLRHRRHPDGRASPSEAEKLVAHPFAEAIEALDAYPYPTVAALNGHAIGGGLEVALSCDLRIAADGHQARDAAGQARAGLLPHRHPQVPRRDRRRAHARAVPGRPQHRRRDGAALGPGQRRRRRPTSSRARRSTLAARSPATRRCRSPATSG